MKSRVLLWVGAAALFGVLSGNLFMRNPRAVQNLPLTKAARAPYDPESVHQTLTFFAGRARQDPGGAIVRAMLAHWYLESYRETGDNADVIGAEKAARASLKIRSRNNGDAFFQLSRSLVAQHRFSEALTVARRASLYDLTSLKQCVDIQIEIGDYQAAARDLARVPREKNDPAFLSLQARLMEIRGNTGDALRALQTATRQADANLDMPPQSVAWFHERLGRMLSQLGHLDEAKFTYLQGLQVFPRDYRTMAALSRLEAARGDWKRSIQWGEKASAIVPAPDTIALLGDAYLALGDKTKAAQKYRLVETIGQLARSQGVIYDRQRAVFYADHKRNLSQALILAHGELKSRKDIYAYDALAWIHFQRGEFKIAQAASDKALSWNTRDAVLLYHAGLIAAALGQDGRAKSLLTRALNINPFFLTPGAPHRARAVLAHLETASPVARQSAA